MVLLQLRFNCFDVSKNLDLQIFAKNYLQKIYRYLNQDNNK